LRVTDEFGDGGSKFAAGLNIRQVHVAARP